METNIKHPFYPINSIDLKVTEKCQLKCSFCVNEDWFEKNQDAVVEKVIRALQELANAPVELWALDNIYFTWWETLLRLWLIEQIASSVSSDIYTSIVTNWLLLNRTVINRLKQIHLSRLKVSYDTTSPDLFSEIRKWSKPEDLRKIEKWIEMAVIDGIIVFIRVALWRYNADNLNDIYKKAIDMWIDTMQIKPIISSWRAKELWWDKLLTRDEFMKCFEKLVGIYDSTRTKVSISCFPPARNFWLPVKNCANNRKFYWELDGRMFTCNYRLKDLVYMFRKSKISIDEIKENKKNYVMLFKDNRWSRKIFARLWGLTWSNLIYWLWEGYLEKWNLRELCSEYWINFLHLHTSWHGWITEMKKLVNACNPKKIMPIHTKEPDKYKRYFNTVILLEDWKDLEV